ncbi:MAG: 3'-5' exonuclease [Candidatus Gracilibacteria bacterium]|nr:3'-5' exonuclease [Candidatus Gracilibacteria bacterium]
MQFSLFEANSSGLNSKDGEKVLFLDTETTDNSEDARLVQLAYKNMATKEVVNEFFKPPVAISIDAMSVSHITNKMVSDKPDFLSSDSRKKLIGLLSDHVLVAHNAPFDIRVLKNEGVVVYSSIDTLRVARHLIESESYKLQYLRYLLDIEVNAVAHDAFSDVLVLERLYYHLEDLMKVKFDIQNRFEMLKKMIELSKTPVLIPSLNFGKYRGKTFNEIVRIDRPYLEWLLSSEYSKSEHEQNEDLLYTISENLKK